MYSVVSFHSPKIHWTWVNHNKDDDFSFIIIPKEHNHYLHCERTGSKSLKVQLIPILWHAILVLYTVHLSKIRIMSPIWSCDGELGLQGYGPPVSVLLWPAKHPHHAVNPRQNPAGATEVNPLAPRPVTLCDPWSHPLQHLSDSLTQESANKRI